MASIGVRFGRALLMVRGSNGVAAAVNFYQNGLGMAIVSTSKGIMSDNEARNQKVGGEIICKIF